MAEAERAYLWGRPFKLCRDWTWTTRAESSEKTPDLAQPTLAGHPCRRDSGYALRLEAVGESAKRYLLDGRRRRPGQEHSAGGSCFLPPTQNLTSGSRGSELVASCSAGLPACQAGRGEGARRVLIEHALAFRDDAELASSKSRRLFPPPSLANAQFFVNCCA